MSSNDFLHLWLGLVGISGIGFNYWLLRFFESRATVRSWKLALVCGVVTYVGVMLAANSIIRFAFDALAAKSEEVGYFVHPPLTFFIIVPVALWAYYLPRWHVAQTD